MSDQYYTASEAQSKLGLSKAMFFRKVRQGFIRKIVLPGMKQGVYPKRDIDGLALSMQMIFDQQQGIIFSPSSIADQVEELEIGIRSFGHSLITPLPERIAFQQRNELTFQSLKVGGKVVGYLSMFNLSPSWLDDLLTGKKIEHEIKVSDVQLFPRLEPFDIYIDVMAVDPTLSAHLRHLYAGTLVSRFLDQILTMKNNGYLIENVYTVTTSRAGEQLVRKLGFTKMEGKSLVPQRIAYCVFLDHESLLRLRSLSQRALVFDHR
jgi:hypothetical protein